MTDYLLVHGAGQGAWVWGRVWGYMTAPEEHPPTLHKTRRANHVYPMDLPGHGADAGGDTSGVRLDDCVEAITRTVEREGLKDLVLVGHGFGGSLVFQAAQLLPQPPKRVVLVGGIVPAGQRSLISVCSRPIRTGFGLLSFLSALSRREVKVPRPVIDRYLCNTMDPMEIVQMIGFMGALPTRGPELQARSGGGRAALPPDLRGADPEQTGFTRIAAPHRGPLRQRRDAGNRSLPRSYVATSQGTG